MDEAWIKSKAENQDLGKRVLFVALWNDFLQRTTAHGPPHINNAKGPGKKIFWCLISIGCLTLLIYHITTVSIYYLTRPITVHIDLIKATQLDFPAVTVCNISPIKSSALSNSPELMLVLGSSSARERKRRTVPSCTNTLYTDPSGGQTCYWNPDLGATYTFQGAIDKCANLGATLFVLNDEAKHQHVTNHSIVLNGTGIRTWTYMTRSPNASTWYYYGTDLVSWAPWDSSYPAFNTGCECVVVQDEGRVMVDDWVCTDTALVICELYYPAATAEPDMTTTLVSEVSNDKVEPTTATFTTMTTQQPDTETTATTPAQPTTDTTTTTPALLTTDTTTITPALLATDTITPTQPTTETTTPTQPTTEITTPTQPTTDTTTTTPTQPTTDTTTPTQPTTEITTTPPAQPTTDTITTTPTQPTTETTTPTQPTTDTTTTTQPTTDTTTTTQPTTETTTPTQPTTDTITTTPAQPTTDTTTTTQPTTDPTTTTPTQPTTTTTSTTHTPVVPQIREDFEKREDVLEVLAGMSQNEKRNLGYFSDEFLLDCQYAGYTCTASQFNWFYDAMHGNCYTFNSGWNDSDVIIQATKPGRRYGLKLVLNINQREYIDRLGEMAGAVVVVHPQSDMPFPQDAGILAPPGQFTSIGIKMTEIERMSEPYGICADPKIRNFTRNVFEELFPVNYSISACLKTCYQRQMIEHCGCADPQFPAQGEAFVGDDIEVCASRNKDECNQYLRSWFERHSDSCNCPTSCRERSYVSDVSVAQWPSDVYQAKILKDLEFKLEDSALNLSDLTTFRNNILKVEVFYQHFSYEKIKEKPAYPDASYYSDLGGILGLWIGCSLLSLFEFIELLADFTLLGCSSKRKIPQKDVRQNDVESRACGRGDRSPPPGYEPGRVVYRRNNNLVVPSNKGSLRHTSKNNASTVTL